jgi:hypothetical protein
MTSEPQPTPTRHATRPHPGRARVVGTVLGLAVAAPILAWGPQGVRAVLVIVVLEVLTELVPDRAGRSDR